MPHEKISKWAGLLLLSIIILIFAEFLARNSASYFILEEEAHVYASRAGIYLEAASSISGNLLTHTTVKHVLLHLE